MKALIYNGYKGKTETGQTFCTLSGIIQRGNSFVNLSRKGKDGKYGTSIFVDESVFSAYDGTGIYDIDSDMYGINSIRLCKKVDLTNMLS